jgi:hypothetical protein
LRREIHYGLNVVEQWNGATDFVFCDAKIFEWKSVLEVRACCKPFTSPLPILGLSSDKERAQKVISRFEAVPLLLGLRALSPRHGAAEGSRRSGSFFSAGQANQLRVDPSSPAGAWLCRDGGRARSQLEEAASASAWISAGRSHLRSQSQATSRSSRRHD